MAARRLTGGCQMNVWRCTALSVVPFALFASLSVCAKTHVILESKVESSPSHSQVQTVNGVQTHQMTQAHRTEKKAIIAPHTHATQHTKTIQTSVLLKNSDIKKTVKPATQQVIKQAVKQPLNTALRVTQSVKIPSTDIAQRVKPAPIFAADIKHAVPKTTPVAAVNPPSTLASPEAFVAAPPTAYDAINDINQRFSAVPVKYCPRTSNGYGFEMRYPSTNGANVGNGVNGVNAINDVAMTFSAPIVTRVYGRAYAAGLQKNAQLMAVNGQSVRSQHEFNALIYDGKTATADHLIPNIQLTVLQNDTQQDIQLTKGDYCLSNLAIESEHNILRLNQETKGSGYSVTAETTAFVDAGFLTELSPVDRLTLAAVAAGEQYRHGLKIKRGKTGMIFGQIFGTIVTFTTGIPITEVTTSSSAAIGMKEDGEGALRPAASYGHYLGLSPDDMRASLEKLAVLKESYRAQGQRYDWFVRSDLREFDAAVQEINALAAQGVKNIMLKPQLFANKKEGENAGQAQKADQPSVEVENGVGSY